jgi:hypothetical protein
MIYHIVVSVKILAKIDSWGYFTGGAKGIDSEQPAQKPRRPAVEA